METYCIYYRGQCINYVDAARSEKDALRQHFKQFAKGKGGKEIAVAQSQPQEVHLKAAAESGSI